MMLVILAMHSASLAKLIVGILQHLTILAARLQELTICSTHILLFIFYLKIATVSRSRRSLASVTHLRTATMLHLASRDSATSTTPKLRARTCKSLSLNVDTLVTINTDGMINATDRRHIVGTTNEHRICECLSTIYCQSPDQLERLSRSKDAFKNRPWIS